jgi:ribosome-associated protein
MKTDELKQRGLESGFVFSAARSSGPGGQNVNKVNTRIELRFDLKSSVLFSEDEKNLIFEKLNNRINNKGEIIIISQSERTQLLNKTRAAEKFFEMISKALTVRKKRKPTKPTVSSRIKRVETKKHRGEIKKLRKSSE